MVLGFVVVQAAFYLFRRARERARERDEREALERMVPVVMERIVMAALAGLDITSGIQAIIELHDDQDSSREVDPVTRLLMQVMQRAEHGAGFAHALQSVAATVPSVAVRHAFIHLAVAHQEGGEVVQPLRELSDASQVFYQENLEEYISRLPVQATLPLLCTFSGLLLFFLTTPLIQVMELLQSIELPG
jgi:Flp pilus assembly protein TadB